MTPSHELRVIAPPARVLVLRVADDPCRAVLRYANCRNTVSLRRIIELFSPSAETTSGEMARSYFCRLALTRVCCIADTWTPAVHG